MYPIERSLRTLKQYVRNKARPEGSIAEAFIMNECLTFCSMYLTGIETRFNRDPRNDDPRNDQFVCGDFDVFRQNVQPMGGLVMRTMSKDEKQTCHWYVLNTCSQIEPYRRYISNFMYFILRFELDTCKLILCLMFLLLNRQHLRSIHIRGEDGLDLFRRHQLEFPDWFRAHVSVM